FASFYKKSEFALVSTSWQDTMNSLPANITENSVCPTGGGGHGFNGCGCNIIVGMDNTPQRALGAIYETWVDLANDTNDAWGNQCYEARWQCNYPLTSTGPSAWELP